jgi:acyl-CoA synthetase (NDP forming)
MMASYHFPSAVFIVPAEKTLEPLKECAAKKVPAAVIASGGTRKWMNRGPAFRKKS